MARQLLNMATDDDVSDTVKLAAIRDALDRAGVSGKAELELSVKEPKPYEQIFNGFSAMSRADYRAHREGSPPPPVPAPLALSGAKDAEEEVVEAEVVPDTAETPPSGPRRPLPPPDRNDAHCEPAEPATSSTEAALVPMEDALAAAAEANRKSGVYPVRQVGRGR